jgi:hypothetical protein
VVTSVGFSGGITTEQQCFKACVESTDCREGYVCGERELLGMIQKLCEPGTATGGDADAGAGDAG